MSSGSTQETLPHTDSALSVPTAASTRTAKATIISHEMHAAASTSAIQDKAADLQKRCLAIGVSLEDSLRTLAASTDSPTSTATLRTQFDAWEKHNKKTYLPVFGGRKKEENALIADIVALHLAMREAALNASGTSGTPATAVEAKVMARFVDVGLKKAKAAKAKHLTDSLSAGTYDVSTVDPTLFTVKLDSGTVTAKVTNRTDDKTFPGSPLPVVHLYMPDGMSSSDFVKLIKKWEGKANVVAHCPKALTETLTKALSDAGFKVSQAPAGMSTPKVMRALSRTTGEALTVDRLAKVLGVDADALQVTGAPTATPPHFKVAAVDGIDHLSNVTIHGRTTVGVHADGASKAIQLYIPAGGITSDITLLMHQLRKNYTDYHITLHTAEGATTGALAGTLGVGDSRTSRVTLDTTSDSVAKAWEGSIIQAQADRLAKAATTTSVAGSGTSGATIDPALKAKSIKIIDPSLTATGKGKPTVGMEVQDDQSKTIARVFLVDGKVDVFFATGSTLAQQRQLTRQLRYIHSAAYYGSPSTLAPTAKPSYASAYVPLTVQELGGHLRHPTADTSIIWTPAHDKDANAVLLYSPTGKTKAALVVDPSNPGTLQVVFGKDADKTEAQAMLTKLQTQFPHHQFSAHGATLAAADFPSPLAALNRVTVSTERPAALSGAVTKRIDLNIDTALAAVQNVARIHQTLRNITTAAPLPRGVTAKTFGRDNTGIFINPPRSSLAPLIDLVPKKGATEADVGKFINIMAAEFPGYRFRVWSQNSTTYSRIGNTITSDTVSASASTLDTNPQTPKHLREYAASIGAYTAPVAAPAAGSAATPFADTTHRGAMPPHQPGTPELDAAVDL